ncbi:hypothetical protein L9F63_002634, partial [Diploptera punctata]
HEPIYLNSVMFLPQYYNFRRILITLKRYLLPSALYIKSECRILNLHIVSVCVYCTSSMVSLHFTCVLSDPTFLEFHRHGF